MAVFDCVVRGWHAHLIGGVHRVNMEIPDNSYRFRGKFSVFEISAQESGLWATTAEGAWPLLCS